jgi:hypothetical protein
LEVGGEWCLCCHVFQNLLTSDQEIGARLHAGFVVVKVNWSPENENARFLSAYPPIPSYPHFFVLDGDGTYLWSQNGAQFEKGRNGYDRIKVLAFIERWTAHPKGGTLRPRAQAVRISGRLSSVRQVDGSGLDSGPRT